MKRTSWIVLLLIATSAVAQDVVKIAVLNNAVLVPVKLNGKEFSFLLDTGVKPRSSIPQWRTH